MVTLPHYKVSSNGHDRRDAEKTEHFGGTQRGFTGKREQERERFEIRKEASGVRCGQYGDLLPEREAEPNSRSLAVSVYGTELLKR